MPVRVPDVGGDSGERARLDLSVLRVSALKARESLTRGLSLTGFDALADRVAGLVTTDESPECDLSVLALS